MVFDNLRHDVRYAVRSYVKAPSFTVAVLATLALGIGASTAIFSMVNGILLQPLPLREPDRLVYINEVNPVGIRISVSWPSYLDWVQRARSVESLAASRDEALTLSRVERAQRLRARRVTAGFFTVVGARPAVGHDFSPDADRPNAAGEAIVSHEFWRTRLGGDGSVYRTAAHARRCLGTPSWACCLRDSSTFAPVRRVRVGRSGVGHAGRAGARQSQRLQRGGAAQARRHRRRGGSEFKAIADQLEREYPTDERRYQHPRRAALRSYRRRRSPHTAGAVRGGRVSCC